MALEIIILLAIIPLLLLAVGLWCLLHWESAEDNYRSRQVRENIKKVAR